jgi:hypothetical protein
MVTQGANVRRGVLVFSSIFVTAQVFALAGTVVFYLYASTAEYRDHLSKAIFTNLYHRYQWRWLRRSKALEVIKVTFLLCVAACVFGNYLKWQLLFGETRKNVFP